MARGDHRRKITLAEYGFRLPSCIDNRPLRFNEWDAMRPQTVCVSATPGPWEMDQTGGVFAEQVIRPTGLIDPPVEIRPIEEARSTIWSMRRRRRPSAGYRSLVTTLTKRMAEDLTEYLHEAGLKVRYMHSDVETLERIELIRDLRLGVYDVLVGINLLREGLDIPECGLVAILDADKEGFLRSETSLIQTIGRAARNVDGKVILYADRITGSMERAMPRPTRRREKQQAYNLEHGITPETIRRKSITDIVGHLSSNKDQVTIDTGIEDRPHMVGHNLRAYIEDLEKQDARRRRRSGVRGSRPPAGMRSASWRPTNSACRASAAARRSAAIRRSGKPGTRQTRYGKLASVLLDSSTILVSMLLAMPLFALFRAIYSLRRRWQVALMVAAVFATAVTQSAFDLLFTAFVAHNLEARWLTFPADLQHSYGAAFNYATVFAVNCALFQLAAGRRRAIRQERELAESPRERQSRPRSTRCGSNINPHFLFNTLNAISAMVVTATQRRGGAGAGDG
jgi:hypothetical protein